MRIFKNKRHWQLPAFYTSYLLQQKPGVLSLFCIPIDYCRPDSMLYSIQHPFDIGYKTLAGGAGIDPYTEFRDLDRSCHASHDPD